MSLLWNYIPYQCNSIFDHIEFSFRCTNSILLWWLYIFIQVLWLFSEIIEELWAMSSDYKWIRNVMHGCWNYPTKSSTVLYLLECLLYLSVSTGTLRLYRIIHEEIKLIVYCVVFIVTDLWLTFKPGYGCGVPTTWSLSFFFFFFRVCSNRHTSCILRSVSPDSSHYVL